MIAWRGDPAEIVTAFDRDEVHRVFLQMIEGRRPGWHRDAACRGTDPDLWFPPSGRNPRAAIAVCDSCPVQRECFAEAIADPDLDHGVRGGTTPNGRRAHRRGAA